MGRILSALLILVLALSHGPMSAAVPHLDGSAHAHIQLVDSDHHDDHAVSDPQVAQADSAPGGFDDVGKAAPGLGHHSHVVTDIVPASGVTFAASAIDKDRLRAPDDSRLRSATLEPLPEPPSA